MKFLHFLQMIALFMVLALPASAQEPLRPQPEISTGTGQVSVARGQDFMIVTANPYATRAGYEILKKGGSAADAAITAQLVLGLTEPQSSGLGGGAFLLHYDAKTQKLTSYDGRETAPGLAGPFMFQQQGQPMGFMEAVVGGRAVGVPGIPALLKETHELHGKLTWMELFDAPIRLAEEGFAVSPRLSKMVADAAARLSKNEAAAAYFLPAGKPLQPGHLLKNPAYAETLKDYAFYGPSRFYLGDIAAKITQVVQNIEANPGLLTPADFAAYNVKQRGSLCGPYRGYIVCSMGEPSSGGLTLLQMLGMLERFDLRALGPDNPQSWHLIAQASALAFADRNMYMADPDFVNTPGIALVDPAYLKARAALIQTDKPLEKPAPGHPPGWTGPLYEQGDSLARPGTSHISVIDKDGNIVSMTTTIEGAFGAHVMVDGFLLNNQLTDFAFTPLQKNRHPVGEKATPSNLNKRDPQCEPQSGSPYLDPRCLNEATPHRGDDSMGLVANMAEGGKRPRSSMSPTIVFDQNGAPVLVLGSAGGSRIIGYVLQRIIATLDWDMALPESLGMPHILARGSKIEMEEGARCQNKHPDEGQDLAGVVGDPGASPGCSDTLKGIGNKVEIRDLNSGLTAIQVDAGTLTGAADPRREGLALGQ